MCIRDRSGIPEFPLPYVVQQTVQLLPQFFLCLLRTALQILCVKLFLGQILRSQEWTGTFRRFPSWCRLTESRFRGSCPTSLPWIISPNTEDSYLYLSLIHI